MDGRARGGDKLALPTARARHAVTELLEHEATHRAIAWPEETGRATARVFVTMIVEVLGPTHDGPVE
jgi:hypothetical protein